jgi:hypothetical protein
MSAVDLEIRQAFARQFHAALEMVEKAIRGCPETVWLDASGDSPNRFWHIAYHVLFYTHLYLQPGEADFIPFRIHRPDYNFLGVIPSRPGELPLIDQPFEPAELLDYAQFCHSEVDRQMPMVDFESQSGFFWLPLKKPELQIYNLRHLAHHTGQLTDRLRTLADVSVSWVR